VGELSPWHWAIVIVIFVVLFGAKRLPDAARSLGRSARILKAELSGETPEPAVSVSTTAPTPVEHDQAVPREQPPTAPH
jgi:sec-independent protein translocase protein TatA